jgi:hypothetical protein
LIFTIQDLPFKPKYLVTFTVGIAQKENINRAVKKVILPIALAEPFSSFDENEAIGPCAILFSSAPNYFILGAAVF